MNTYQERKNSGVEWLGEIPRHWRREHLKRFAARIQTGVTPPTDTPDYYLDGTVPWFAPGSYDGNLELSEPSKFINEVALHDGAIRMFPAGTVFLIGIGATIGKVGLITEPASCNQQIIGITCNRRMNSRYLAYQLKIYEDVIPGIASGTTLPIFDQVKTGYLPVLQPPLLEQERIAAYLDASCAAIDAAVTAKRGQLETLDALRKDSITRAITRGLNPRIRTKSTGQDWIGEIPEHWSAPCLKRLLREPLTYGLNEAAELEERNLPRYLRITDFDDDGNLRADTFRSLPLEIAREALLEPNDVLFARSGATVGKTFMFRNYDGEACFAGYLIRARTLLWKLDPLSSTSSPRAPHTNLGRTSFSHRRPSKTLARPNTTTSSFPSLRLASSELSLPM